MEEEEPRIARFSLPLTKGELEGVDTTHQR